MTNNPDIIRWAKIIETTEGRQRLVKLKCSLILGREFGESVEAFLARSDEFTQWAFTQL